MNKKYTVCIAGNPNTGKSSIFNKLTKLRQHTGNWSGKTVANAKGHFSYQNNDFTFVDVPGTYSLFGLSEEEIVARNYICFEKNDAILVVCDATSLTKNLNLAFQTLEYNKNVILVVNLIDEASRNHITLNRIGLMVSLGIPVVFTSAKTNKGLDYLKKTILDVVEGKFPYSYKETDYGEITKLKEKLILQLEGIKQKEMIAMRILDASFEFMESLQSKYLKADYEKILSIRKEYNNQEDVREIILSKNFERAKKLCDDNVCYYEDNLNKTKRIDKIITSKRYGIPLMILLLFIIFFITIKLANYPSELLANFFNWLSNILFSFLKLLDLNESIINFIVLGIYNTTAQVVSVMLPPMAIFFPLFTILEDLGYLPRIAFNLDHRFKKAGCNGKQCLTMCMGFGCNAAGVIGTRIITSPRERIIAILTNNFVPCNGRFPLIFILMACFFSSFQSTFANSFIPAFISVGIIILGILVTLLVSKILSVTLLKGISSSFTLELPPYRKPNVLQILYTSIVSRTLFVLGRAVIIAAPVGALIWILSNTYISGNSLITIMSNFLNPIGIFLGLDGVILLAFILAFPANEIVLPIIILGYTSGSYLASTSDINNISLILSQNGWTWMTAILVLLFSLLHWPCSTTLLTIHKETKSKKWTLLAFLIPTIIAILTVILVNGLFKIFI